MTLRRQHTTANIAPALVKLRKQVDAKWPNRDRRSDGIWPSAAHTAANPTSDHEAGNALDIDTNLSKTTNASLLFRRIKASKDPRVRYIIHAGRIWSPERGDRPYSGTNPHDTHIHISVRETRRRDVREWRIEPTARKYPGRIIKRGERDASIVLWIQRRLVHHGYGVTVDGDFGDKTYAAVKRFRERRFRARPQTGNVGPVTWTHLARG